jgi:hypothetical protein
MIGDAPITAVENMSRAGRRPAWREFSWLSVREGRRALLACGVFAVVTLAHAASPVSTSFDSRWAIHTAASLLAGHGGALDDFVAARAVDAHAVAVSLLHS